MRIVFWQNCLSPHQLPYIVHLMDDKRVDEVVVVTEESISDERKKMGWELGCYPQTEKCSIIISPNNDKIRALFNMREADSWHLFSGIHGFPFIFHCFKISLVYNIKRGIVTECPYTYAFGSNNGKPLWLHSIRFFLQDYKYAKYIDKVFAMGNRATKYFKSVYSKWNVYPFMYCTQPKEKNNLIANQTATTKFLFVGSLSYRKSPKIISSSLVSCIKNNSKFDKFKEVPHNILSYYMMYIELNNFSKCFFDENNLASYAILNHHHYIDNFKYITCEDNRKLILDRLLNIYPNLDKNRKEKLDRNLKKIKDSYKENQRDFIKILGLLNKCDYSASAHIPAEFYPNFLEKGLDNLLNSWKREDDKANWNELQNFCKENKKENLIVIAQTGMGKTEAGLHWIGDTKGFFVLPLKTAINSIYYRITNNICNGEEIEERVALLHSDTLSMYLENFDGEDNDKILSYYENSKKFSIPLNITTPDQIFDFVFRSKGFEFKNAMMSYSKVVIDEIQAYSPELLATLIRGIQDIIEIGGKVCIITATFPPFIKDLLLMENLDYLNEQEQKYKFITKEFTNDMKRHNVKILDEELNSEYIYNHYIKNNSKSKKYLVVCNTIKKSQEVFADLKQKGLENVNILHSKFIKKERNEKENKIIEVGKTENIGNEIWISTQIVEASLDIDFDFLFTELSDLNGLFQRLGRVNRKGKKEVNDYNCYVFTEINKNLLKENKDSKKGFIYKEIYDLSNLFL